MVRNSPWTPSCWKVGRRAGPISIPAPIHKENKKGVVLVCTGSLLTGHWVIPTGFALATRSKMMYGTPLLSRSPPSISPPRPPPTIRTLGLFVVDMVVVDVRLVAGSDCGKNESNG